MKRSGYEIANEVENKQNGGQGGISVELSGTLYRPVKFSLLCRIMKKDTQAVKVKIRNASAYETFFFFKEA